MKSAITLSLTAALTATACSTLPPPDQFKDYSKLSSDRIQNFNTCVSKTDSRLAKAYAATHPVVHDSHTAEDFERMTPEEGRTFLIETQKDMAAIVTRMARRLEASMAICANEQGINPATVPTLDQVIQNAETSPKP